MITDSTRSALRFWRTAYMAGVRITCDGDTFQFGKALNYWQRLQTFGAFGMFPKDEQVAPVDWISDGVAEHEGELRKLLLQPFPAPYQRFAAHVLTLDYEVRPIVRHAKMAGHDVGSIAMDGGHFLTYGGKCSPTKESYQVPALPAILNHVKELRI